MTSRSEPGEITTLIQQWRTGNREAADKLMEKVYPELKKIARAYLKKERLNHTLAPTALVNELYLKLVGSNPVAAHDRSHFFALAAQNLRRILVDYARLHRAKKRGGNAPKITLSATGEASELDIEGLLTIHDALLQLQKLDSRAAQVVELRFFGGLTEEEVAEVLQISETTVQRDWKTARAWLISRLTALSNPRQKTNPA